ncbi:MAG TPA: hypothetical protein VL101_10710 [Nordella sp.]|nr:hypothetical protein [Nordella sp.]
MSECPALYVNATKNPAQWPGFVSRMALSFRANPAKVEGFGDKDLLQDIDLARILFGEVIPLRRDAR